MLIFIIDIKILLVFIKYINMVLYIYGKINNFTFCINIIDKYCYLIFIFLKRQLSIKLLNYSLFKKKIFYFNPSLLKIKYNYDYNLVYFYYCFDKFFLVSNQNKILIVLDIINIYRFIYIFFNYSKCFLITFSMFFYFFKLFNSFLKFSRNFYLSIFVFNNFLLFYFKINSIILIKKLDFNKLNRFMINYYFNDKIILSFFGIDIRFFIIMFNILNIFSKNTLIRLYYCNNYYCFNLLNFQYIINFDSLKILSSNKITWTNDSFFFIILRSKMLDVFNKINKLVNFNFSFIRIIFFKNKIYILYFNKFYGLSLENLSIYLSKSIKLEVLINYNDILIYIKNINSFLIKIILNILNKYLVLYGDKNNDCLGLIKIH